MSDPDELKAQIEELQLENIELEILLKEQTQEAERLRKENRYLKDDNRKLHEANRYITEKYEELKAENYRLKVKH